MSANIFHPIATQNSVAFEQMRSKILAGIEARFRGRGIGLTVCVHTESEVLHIYTPVRMSNGEAVQCNWFARASVDVTSPHFAYGIRSVRLTQNQFGFEELVDYKGYGRLDTMRERLVIAILGFWRETI